MVDDGFLWEARCLFGLHEDRAVGSAFKYLPKPGGICAVEVKQVDAGECWTRCSNANSESEESECNLSDQCDQMRLEWGLLRTNWTNWTMNFSDFTQIIWVSWRIAGLTCTCELACPTGFQCVGLCHRATNLLSNWIALEYLLVRCHLNFDFELRFRFCWINWVAQTGNFRKTKKKRSELTIRNEMLSTKMIFCLFAKMASRIRCMRVALRIWFDVVADALRIEK